MPDYRGTYRDTKGTTPIVITNDGKTLSMRLRGADFTGISFDDFEPVPETPAVLHDDFTLRDGALADYAIGLDIPLPMLIDGAAINGAAITGILTIELDLTARDARGRVNYDLTLRLHANGIEVETRDSRGWIEEPLIEIGRGLPPGWAITTCLFCQFGDYSPYGSGFFGSMLCYRRLKQAYLATRDKYQLLDLTTGFEQVQETWTCSEFEPRVIPAGYRGGI